jgi:hypothetical protein
MRPHGLEIDKPYFVINGVPQQIELILAAKLINIQFSQVALFSVSDAGIVRHSLCRLINIGRNVVL